MTGSQRLGLALLLATLVLAAPAAADTSQTPLLRLTHIFSGQPAAVPATASPPPAIAANTPPIIAVAPKSGAEQGPPGRAAAVPMPRLRPAVPAAVASAANKPVDAPRRIDPTITAAINPSPQAGPPAPAPQPPPAAAVPAGSTVATAPQAAVAAPPAAGEPDGLLGDPAASFRQPVATQPDAPKPQAIALPRATGGPLPEGALPPAIGNEPYQRLRQLQLLQDRTAQGSVDALAAERTLIAAMDQAFVTADPAVWQAPQNAVAAVAFVLSGGPPTILAKLASLDPKPAVDRRLVEGVLAYAQGRQSDAATLLTPIDPATLPPTIAAEVAMAQSALAAKTNPESALHLLSLARLLAPGTLVEEAAIRREIFVADQLRDDATVQSLARQYLDRFRHSIYAGNFRDRFAAALTHMDFVNDPAQFSKLDDMLASLEPEARGELYLTIALAGVVAGRLNEATLASSRALSLAVDGSVGKMRAQLYRAAAEVAVAKTFDAASSDYAAVDRTKLAPSDQALFDAVGVAIGAVGSGTTVVAHALAPAATPDPPSTLVTRAQTMLTSVDALLASSTL